MERIGLELQNTDYIGAPLQVDDVDIFNRFILKFKSSSTMRLHFTQIYLQSVSLTSVQGKLSDLIATKHSTSLSYTVHDIL